MKLKNKFGRILMSITICSTFFYSCSYLEKMIIGTSIAEAKESCKNTFSEESYKKSCLRGVELLQSKARRYGEDNIDQAIDSAKGACNTEYSEYTQQNDLGMNYEDACLEGIKFLREIGEGYSTRYLNSIDNNNRNSSPGRKAPDSGTEHEQNKAIEV